MAATYVEKIQTPAQAARDTNRLKRLGVEVVQRRPLSTDAGKVVVTYRVPASVNLGLPQ